MLELDGTIWLRAGEDNWGGRGRIELLAAIGQTGSITAGAKAVGLSYKAAWDAIDTMNNLAGEPLVVRTTGGKGGGGSVLTPRAQRLIESFRVLEAEHRRFVERLDAAAQAASEDVHLLRRLMLRTSARNTLFGTVESVAPGAVNDVVTLRLPGGQAVAATITQESTRVLGLAPGVQAVALIKAPADVQASARGGRAVNRRGNCLAVPSDGSIHRSLGLQPSKCRRCAPWRPSRLGISKSRRHAPSDAPRESSSAPFGGLKSF